MRRTARGCPVSRPTGRPDRRSGRLVSILGLLAGTGPDRPCVRRRGDWRKGSAPPQPLSGSSAGAPAAPIGARASDSASRRSARHRPRRARSLPRDHHHGAHRHIPARLGRQLHRHRPHGHAAAPGRDPPRPRAPAHRADYRVVTASEAEFGLGWHTPHPRLGWFVRLILDDVIFPRAVQASLVADPVGQDCFRLLWSR